MTPARISYTAVSPHFIAYQHKKIGNMFKTDWTNRLKMIYMVDDGGCTGLKIHKKH
tara:strand:- start:147238 stop:147405 length:168 start_codon:yes stop_codon:yes gene_type:complete